MQCTRKRENNVTVRGHGENGTCAAYEPNNVWNSTYHKQSGGGTRERRKYVAIFTAWLVNSSELSPRQAEFNNAPTLM